MNIGIIGCGTMGGAIATALVKSGKHKVRVCDHHPDRIAETGAESASVEDILAASDIVILAVKPQSLPSLIGSFPPETQPAEGWISLAAGWNCSRLENVLGSHEVVRYMPNIAARVGASVTAVCPGSRARQELVDDAVSLAGLFGSAFLLDESLLPAFTGISGSGIAYMFQFIHAMAMGGTHAGIPYGRSVAIVCDTLKSAVALQEAEGKNPVELMTGVCSAAGTTIEGMSILAQKGFDAAVMAAVAAAADKSGKM